MTNEAAIRKPRTKIQAIRKQAAVNIHNRLPQRGSAQLRESSLSERVPELGPRGMQPERLEAGASFPCRGPAITAILSVPQTPRKESSVLQLN